MSFKLVPSRRVRLPVPGLRTRLALYVILVCLFSLPALAAAASIVVTSPPRELLRAILLIAAIYIVWAAAAVLLAVRAFSHLVLKPIRQLQDETRRIAAGNWEKQERAERQDEIGELVHAVDEMAECLKAREAEQAEQTRSREATAGARARELSDQIRVLGDSEAWYRAIVHDQTELILRCRLDGTVTFANDACCRFFQLMPACFLDLFEPADRPSVQARWAALAGREPVVNFEQCVGRPESETRWLQWSLRQLPDEEGRAVAVAATGTDITERKVAEESLLHLNAQLESSVRDLKAELGQTRAHAEASRVRLEKLMAVGPTVICRRNADAGHAVKFVGENCQGMLGYSRAQLESHDFWTAHIHPEDMEAAERGLRRATEEGAARIEYRFKRPDGRYAWLLDSARLVPNVGREPEELVSALNDITRLKRAEEMLRESQERYTLAASAANDGLWDWDLCTNRIYYSPRWKSMLGHEKNEIGETLGEWHNRVHPDDLARLQADLDAHLRGRTPFFENEHRILHADGTYRWVLSRGLLLKGADGEPIRMAGSQSDMTLRKQAEERLVHDSLHEPLTGLPNRALFLDRLEQALKRSEREEKRLAAVLLIDLDRFQVVNDSLGHPAGDELLVDVARRFERVVRPHDTVARLGGDEFAVLLDPVTGVDEATRVAASIQQALAEPFAARPEPITLSASIGIALTWNKGKHAESPDQVLRDADSAMYRAKEQGRARHEVFDESMRVRAVTLLRTEGELRRAMEREELRLYYQPIFSINSGEAAGAEALIRWQHPERGLLPPSEFMDIAEETGLIEPMGEWTLRAACAQARAWRAVRYPRLQVAVNFSARQFQNPNLSRLVEQVLHETGLEPHGLELEITETTAMQDPQLSGRILRELSELGVEISIDDFGNRYSALGRLQTFPVKILKIDQVFLRDIAGDANNAALTTAIIAMGRSLNLRVIAEGVENEDQLRFLIGENCDQIQGYMFGRPLPPDALSRLLPMLPEKLMRYIRRSGPVRR